MSGRMSLLVLIMRSKDQGEDEVGNMGSECNLI
jgi:hypothetical protein